MIKSFFLVFIFATTGAIASFSQTVNGTPIAEIDVDYVEIVGISKPLSTKVAINIDFGQTGKRILSKDARIKDINGETKIFNSMIDALNFMSKNGYDFVQVFTTRIGDVSTQRYLMKKRKE